MDEKNPLALALAFKRARGRTAKINELGLTSSMKTETVDKLIKDLSIAKAKENGNEEKWPDEVSGQRWYIEDLIEFSKMDAQTRLDHEYNKAIPDVADEDEMLSMLTAMMA